MTDELRRLVEGAEARWLELWRRGPTRLQWTSLPPQAGDPAPDLELEDAEGRRVRLSEFWRDRPALLLFWRHYGCGCGMDRAGRLQEEFPQYRSAGANVLVIGQGEPARALAYAETYGIPCPVLCDPDFRTYEAYGLLEFTPSQVLYDASSELLRKEYEAGVALAAARRELGRPLVDSPWQAPGEFVVDPAGVLRLAYRYQYCEDYPDPRVLLAAIQEASG